jgi:hypothetical protein
VSEFSDQEWTEPYEFCFGLEGLSDFNLGVVSRTLEGTCLGQFIADELARRLTSSTGENFESTNKPRRFHLAGLRRELDEILGPAFVHASVRGDAELASFFRMAIICVTSILDVTSSEREQ